MSTFTPSIGLEEIAPGTQAGLWGDSTNNNLNLIDQAVTGVTPLSFAGLSGTVRVLESSNGAEDEARSAVLNITGGATGANTVVVPNKQKTYLVRNNTNQNVVFQTPAPVATFTINAGNSILIFCDGANNVFTGIASPSVGTLGVSGGGTGQTNFGGGGFVISAGGTSNLATQSTVGLGGSVTNQIAGQLQVTNGGTGISNVPAGQILRGSGSSPMAAISAATDQVLTWSGSQWEGRTPATAAVISVFARTGVITAQSGDYSAFYASLNGANTFAGVNTFNGNTVFENTGLVTIKSQALTYGLFTGGTTTTNSMIFTSNSINFADTVTGNQFNSIFYTSQGGTPLASQVYAFNYKTPGVASATSAYQFYGDGTANKTGGGSWGSISDARLKENVTPLTGALEKITALNPVSYTWKITAENNPTVGFLAQEVQQVIPNAVTSKKPTELEKPFTSDAILSIGWQNDMTAYLVGAIKELKSELDQAKTEIAALKAKV